MDEFFAQYKDDQGVWWSLSEGKQSDAFHVAYTRLEAAEAEAAKWRELHDDRDRDLAHEFARANAAEDENARLKECQDHPDDLWETRCTVAFGDGMVVVGGTTKAVDETVRRLRRLCDAEAENTQLNEAMSNLAVVLNERNVEIEQLRATLEAAEASLLAAYEEVARQAVRAEAAEAELAACLSSDRARYNKIMTTKLGAAEAENARLRETLATILDCGSIRKAEQLAMAALDNSGQD